MSSGKNPLMLMMALAMPGAAQAIGLGDIHVQSNLNERLVAEIDIVGASALELADLRAAVANRDTFVRLGVDRPAFLSSATFKVGQNSQGRPVLAVRSSDSFTEPLVNFLVDLRWHDGELVREYTLLLDPAGLDTPLPAAVTPAAPVAAPPAAKPTVENKAQTVANEPAAPAEQADSVGAESRSRTTTHIKVGAKATLRGIAWRVGERSPSDLQRMMIAIFRANPSAFDGNINRLHLGALLTIPSHEDLASISAAEAKREVHAQMTAWRSTGANGRAVVVNTTGAAAVAALAGVALIPAAVAPAAAANAELPQLESPAPDTTPASDPAATTSAEEATALGHRVESLEQELGAVKGALDSKNQQLESLRQQELDADKAALADKAQAEPVEAQLEATPTVKAAVGEPAVKHSSVVPTAVGLGTLGAALAALYFRLRRRKPGSKDEDAAASDSMADTIVVGTEEAPQVQPQLKVQQPLPPPPPQQAPKIVAPQPAPIVQQDVSEDDQALERAIEAAAIYEATHPMLPVVADTMTVATGIIAGEATATMELSRSLTADATVKLSVEPKLPVESGNKRVDTSNTRVETKLDYNLVDLDMTVQHVHMPSALNETPVVKERRTNLADVLKLALEREPNRHDLRMKLLELYFAAATTNRNGFLDVVQKLAQDRNYRQSEHWEKIAAMGRQILSDSPLFLDELVGDDDVEDVRKVS